MNRKESTKLQPRVLAPNPSGSGRPVHQFASKMNQEDIDIIQGWIETKEDIIYCIDTLVKYRGITKPTAYRWYEKVALMIGKSKA